MKDKVQASAEIVLGHLDEEIKVRQAELTQLTGMQAGLRELYSVAPPVETVQTPERPKAKAAKKPKTGGASVVTRTGSGRAPSPDGLKLLATARTAAEPFTAASLKEVSGLDMKWIGKALARWATAGYVERAGTGEYRRSAGFPTE